MGRRCAMWTSCSRPCGRCWRKADARRSSDFRAMASDAIQRLTRLLPAGRIMSSPAHLSAYESDGLTAFAAKPLAVAVPETQDEVIAIVRFCHAEKIPFVARGSG